jgi:hypothetical protein
VVKFKTNYTNGVQIMSRSKINSIISEFTEQLLINKWALMSKGIFSIGQELLEDLLTMDIPESEIEARTHIILMGTIVTAVAENQRQIGLGQCSYISNDVHNKFYQVPFYPLNWSELHLQCGMDAVLKQYDQNDKRFLCFNKENPLYLNMIFRIGSKIMSKELPFDLNQLKAGFPEYNEHFDAIAALQIKTAEQQALYQAIIKNLDASSVLEKKFDEILDSIKKSTVLGDKKHPFIDALATLKKNTLHSLNAGNTLFHYDNCMIIVTNVATLTSKINNDKVTQQDLVDFNQNMAPFKANRWIEAFIAIIIGMAYGLVGGFVVAGIPGAIAGTIFGGIGGVAHTLWQVRKKDPVIQMGDVAEQLVIEEPQTINSLGL